MSNPLKRALDTLTSVLPPHDTTVACYPNTMFGRVSVIDTVDPDGFTLRVLKVNDTWQSATYLDEDWAKLVFPYHCLYNDAIREDLDPGRILMLGGGGYAYPKYLLVYEPTCRVDVVEVDPQITKIAHEHFLLDRLDSLMGGPDAGGRLTSFAEDGRAFLERTSPGTYTYIFNDCFASEKPAANLMTAEAAQAVHRALVPGGTYATNVVSALEGTQSQLLRDVVTTLQQSFEHVFVIPCGEDDPTTPDNNVVIATDAEGWEPYDPYVLSPEPVGTMLRDNA